MASSENVEIVRRAFRGAESNEYEASAEFLHEDFEMGMLPDWPGATSHPTWQEAAAMMAAWRSSFDEFRGLPEQFAAVGADVVVVAYHEWGKPRGGSVEMEHLYGILITLRESKLARWDWFESPTDALQAASERSHAELRSSRR